MALLPQTQCRRCGYEGCRPYAKALIRGQAELNRCPPGGDYTRLALASLLQREAKDWEEAFTPQPRTRVTIEAEACIGCGRCLPACPVDAIVGAVGFLHAVLEGECTGCGLCLAPCPVDCFTVTLATTAKPGPWADRCAEEAQQARLRAACKQRRSQAFQRPESVRASRERKRAEIQEALARIRHKRGWQQGARNSRIGSAE